MARQTVAQALTNLEHPQVPFPWHSAEIPAQSSYSGFGSEPLNLPVTSTTQEISRNKKNRILKVLDCDIVDAGHGAIGAKFFTILTSRTTDI